MIRKRSFAVLLLTALALLGGCGGDPKPAKVKTTIAPVTTTTIDPSRIGQVLDATDPLAALSEKLGRPLVLRNATVGIGELVVSVLQDAVPGQATKVDSYVYVVVPTPDGEVGWSEGSPVIVDQADLDRLSLVSFSPSEVAWSQFSALAAERLKFYEAELELPKVITLSVSKGEDSPISVNFDIQGVRGSARVLADAQGNVRISERA